MKIPNGALGVPGTGIESVKEYLEGLGAVPLSATELASINKVRFIAGWKLGVDFGGGQEHMLAMVLPEGFPYEAPRVAVLDAPPILTWPHLEEGKLLCVLPATTAVDPELPTAQIGELLNEAIRLVQSILSGRLDDDFDREFTAYWRRGAATDAQEFVSLLEPSGVHREIQIWRGKSFHVVAETADDLRNWMYKRFGREKAAGMVFAKSLCLVAKAAIRPTDYPRNAADLRRLFVGDHRALELMAAQALGDDDRDIVIAVPTPTGMGFAAVSIAPGGQPSPGGKRVDEFWKGFRKGRMPPNVALQRATSPARKVTRHKVDRVDHSWIHGRDHDSRQVVLKDANVLLVGCGSLGSSVAELLARAGVGNLTLMDGEVLDWANISRHSLGAENVGNPKASALKNRLATAFPHLPQIEAIDRPLTPATADNLAERNLIVTTTGRWAVDSLVNRWQRSGYVGTVLYTWLEPHVAAAHAVTIPPGGACLRCHMTGTGTPELAVTEWKGGGAIPIPSCGGTFAPYGAAELAFAHALVVGQALEALLAPTTDSRHATWIGSTASWHALGGSLSAAWKMQVGDPGEGGVVVLRPWTPVVACPVCGAGQP